MQLKKHKNLRQTLALATTSLLTAAANGATMDSDWEIDSAILFYSETDRVQVIEPVINAKHNLGDEETVSLRFVADSLSGSSPNGAIPTGTTQTFTSASGESTYTVKPNETPLDPEFKDVRYALSGSWEKPLSRLTKATLGLNASGETDYLSIGMSASLARDFNQRNTTLTAGLSYNADSIEPFNGVPVPFSPSNVGTPLATTDSSETKTVTDVLIGWTQVINRSTLMQLNLSVGRDSGYMTDPYKILSVVNPGTDTLRAVDPYLHEYRPDSRARQAIYWMWVKNINDDVLHASYRYYWDDWNIKSHTIDLQYRIDVTDQQYIEPHIRYYQQSKADFYYYKLEDGPLPEFASADYRLADLNTLTVGCKYRFSAGKTSEASARLEYMTQSSAGDDPFPDVNALILQFNYATKF